MIVHSTIHGTPDEPVVFSRQLNTAASVGAVLLEDYSTSRWYKCFKCLAAVNRIWWILALKHDIRWQQF